MNLSLILNIMSLQTHLVDTMFLSFFSESEKSKNKNATYVT